jgi:hypothetical protein
MSSSFVLDKQQLMILTRTQGPETFYASVKRKSTKAKATKIERTMFYRWNESEDDRVLNFAICWSEFKLSIL